MGCRCFTQLLTLFCLMSYASNIRDTHVEISFEPINFMNFMCSDPSRGDVDDSFNYMQIVQFTAQGNETLQTEWATLNKYGHAIPSPDILDVMGKRSLKITGDVRKNIPWLEIVVYDYALDLRMRIYGKFTCFVGYDGKKKTIGKNVTIFPGAALQTQNDVFMVRESRAADLICWASLDGTSFITLSIVRMPDKTLMASWPKNKIPTCPIPKAMCSNLSYINEVVYAKVRLMKESDLGKGFKCIVKTEKGNSESNIIPTARESTKSSDGCSTVWVCVAVVILVMVSSIVFTVIVMKRRKIFDFIRNECKGTEGI